MGTTQGGLYQWGGVPVGDARYTNPWATHYFVDHVNGQDGWDNGKRPNRAFQTIQAAVTKAGPEDVIYVRSVGAVADASDFDYYPEQVIVPYANVNMAIIGVTPHKAGVYMGPWLRYGYGAAHTGYVLLNYAPGLAIENIGFQAGDYIRTSYGAVHMYASTTGGAYTTHAGSVAFTLYNCFFRDGQLSIEGGYDSVTLNCMFQASGSANTGWWNKSSVLPSGGHNLIGSHFSSMFADNQPLRYVYGIAGAHKNMLVKQCTFGLVPADNHYMWFGTSNTGLVAACYFESQDVAVGQDDAESEIFVGTANAVQAVGCYDKTGLLA